MAATPNYAELVEQAERAVQGVKDAELRRIAFQKVLEELLGGGKGGQPATKKKSGRSGAVARRGAQGGPNAYIRELIAEGFFKKPKGMTDVKVELENRGHHIPFTSLSGPLQTLCKQRELRRKRDDGRFVYSNW
jgi:hypothetical protein